MKELIKNSEFVKQIKTSEITAAASVHIAAAFLGLLSSKAAVSETLFPFGISIAAATPYGYIPSVTTGAFIGYFISAITGGGFRYVAALLAVLSIRILLSGYKSVSSSPFFMCLISFLSLAVTAPVAINSDSWVSLAAETLLGAGAAYFFRLVLRCFPYRKAGFGADELPSLLIVLAILISGLGSINIAGVYLYRILCIVLILTAAKYGGPSVSTAAGAAAALSVYFVNENFSVCLIMVIIGICAGVFKTYGKWALSVSAVAVGLVGMMITDNALNPTLFCETVAASAIFAVIPKGFFDSFGKFISFSPKITVQSDLKKMIKIKLLDAADALSDVKNTVNEVSERLSIITAPDFSGMVREIENTSCSGCKLRLHCWENRKSATVDALMSVIEAKKREEERPNDFAGEEFRARCFKFDIFCKNALVIYERYAYSLAAENRAKEIRQVVSEQFEGVSLMLKEAAEDISKAERFDKGAALTVAASLKNLDIIPTESVCRIDKFSRKTVKVKGSVSNDTVINKMQVMKTLSNALECDFSAPVVIKKEKDIFITATESPRYKAETGVCQISASGGKVCGDSYKFMHDGYGRFFAVLSDGMGTGGAAAVDSALSSGLVTRLIRSGINMDSALKIINSSMLFKSTYESSASLDIACIDLFTGYTCIYKAGAAPTVIRRGNRTFTASGASLPIGIINDVHFEKADIRLKAKDILLLMSDGATGEGLEWIKRELENCGDVSAQSLAENIAGAARRRRSDGHEDDITVISVIIEKEI